MTDREALDFLAGKFGHYAELARVLGMSPQAVNNWRDRGIAAAKRPDVWMLVNDHGGNLPREWLRGPAVTTPRRRPDVEAA